VGSTKPDNRTIVRKRTQQLVYLELGRDNGGVMLNLSEEGCSFQAITPVKVGETRFAFQISGGRRIAGDAEIMWVDDVGIMGGLRFLNLPVEARKQIGLWLQETNAPEEYGTAESASATPLDAVARGMRADLNRGAESAEAEYRSAPFPGPRTMTEEAPAPAWAHLRATSAPPTNNHFATIPPLREDGAFVATRARSVSLWRSLVVMALGAVIALIVVFYQHELGGSLIWLGETISGKTKASSVLQETKTTPTSPPVDLKAPSASSDLGAAQPAQQPAPAKAEDPRPDGAAVTPKPVPDTAPPAETPAAKFDSPSTHPVRQESVLEKEALRDRPEVWDSHETVESLWGAVQGGSVAAERSLAERFVRGEGVLKNCEQAKVLLRAAANKGSREARLRLYELETQGCR
jgi:PilZ domain